MGFRSLAGVAALAAALAAPARAQEPATGGAAPPPAAVPATSSPEAGAPTATAAPAPPADPAEIAALVRALGSLEWAERERATRRLSEIGRPAFPALRAALESPDAEVRYRARLVLRAPLRSVKRLLDQLQRSGGGVDDESFKELVALGDEAIEPLVYVLGKDLADYDGRSDERIRAALLAIERIGSRKSVEPLLGLLERNLQRFAGSYAQALRRSGEAEAKAGLLARRGASAAAVRRAAVEVLSLFRGEDVVAALAEALRDADPSVRAEAVSGLERAALGRTSKRPAPIEAFGGQIVVGGRRLVIGRGGVIRLGPGGVGFGEPIPRVDAAPKPPGGEEARRIAERVGTALVGAIDDADAEVQLRAIRAVGALGDARALPRLRAIADAAGEGGEGDERLAAAVAALARLLDRESIPRFVTLLEHARADVSGEAASALGRLEAGEAVPALAARLDATDGTSFVSAPHGTLIAALGRIGDPRAFDALAAYAARGRDRDSAVADAIGRLPGPGPRAWLAERARRVSDVALATVCLERLEARGDEGMLGDDEAVEEAALAFLRADHVPKYDALRILGRRGFRPAYDAVARLLSAPEPENRGAAARCLGEIGDRRAIPLLRPLAAKGSAPEDLRESATIALARLGDDATLAEAVKEGEARVKGAAGPGELTNLGILHLYRGDFDAALACFQRIIDNDAKNDVAAYNLACTHSLAGRSEEALRWLKRAVENGFRDVQHLDADEDLDPIRHLDAFRAIRDEMSGGRGAARSPRELFRGIEITPQGAIIIDGAAEADEEPAEEEGE
jgi:HEAT repeat protein